MDMAVATGLLFSVAQENWIWLSVTLVLGLIAGWMSYPSGSRRETKRH